MVDIPSDFIGIGVDYVLAELLTYLFSQLGIGGVTEVVLAGSSVTVAKDVSLLLLNKSVPGATTIHLGAVSDRTVASLKIVDMAGNAGDITLLPHGAETIMGTSSALMISNGQGYGLAASGTFWSDIGINGWYSA